jgi:hypothetical protein
LNYNPSFIELARWAVSLRWDCVTRSSRAANEFETAAAGEIGGFFIEAAR